MKKLICIVAMLAVFLSVVCPAIAAEDTFVPSISYKDGPETNDADMNDEDVKNCLIVTSLKGASEKTTDISQEARDLLLEVYEKLNSDEDKLPLEEEGYIIRELVDVSWKETDCVGEAHIHEEELEKEGTTVTVEFDLGIKADDKIVIFIYHDDQWKRVEDVVNNGDGTVTADFEDICPVAFCVKANTENVPTGDISARSLLIWFVLMILSMAGIVFMTVNRRKHYR